MSGLIATPMRSAAIAMIALGAIGSAQAQTDPATLVIAQSVDMESFEPDMLNQASSISIASHIWGSLLHITPEGVIEPYFAEAWEWNEAGTEVAFTIREGLTCADGEVLDAEDVAYSLNRAADPENAFIGHTPGFVYSSIKFAGARAEGPWVAILQVEGYNSTVPGMAAKIFIHCKDSYEAMTNEEAAKSPVASGPYLLVSWRRDDRIVLARNPEFDLFETPWNNIVFRVIPEASTRAAELVVGAVDIAANIPPDQMQAIADYGTATVMGVQGTRRMFVGFNFSDTFADTPGGKAISDVAVRQALNMAVDVPSICRQLLATECDRATGPANQGNPDIEPYPYDPARAEEMLDAAGWPRGDDGVRFRLVMQGPNGRYLNDANVQQAVAQYLRDIGVETTNDLMAMSLFSPLVREHRAGPVFFIGQGGATWSAVYDMALFPSRDAPVNNGMWFNQEWQDRWDSLSSLRDPEEERRVANEMIAIFHEDAPWIFLYFQPDFYGVSDRIKWQPRRDEAIEGWTARLDE